MPLFYFFLGIAVLQIIFTGSYFLLFRNKEFLYYMLFTLSLSFFIVGGDYPPLYEFLKSFTGPHLFRSLNLLVLLSIFFYYRFIRYFTETIQRYPRVHRQFLVAEKIILAACLILFLIQVFADHRTGHNSFMVLMAMIVPMNIYFMISLFMKKSKLTNIMVIGSFFLFLFVRLAFFATLYRTNEGAKGIDPATVFSIWGIIMDFIFFDFALIYKSRLMHSENIRLAVEKQIELNEQRLSISSDLHDDIGSSLSSIQLELSLAGKALEKGQLKNERIFLKISEEVKRVIENMNDIIWAVKKGDAEEKSFSNRIKDYYFDLLDARQMECIYEVDRELEAALLSSTCRKNLLLIAKEAMNNAIKHSEAVAIVVALFKEGESVCLEIKDNGKGIPENRSTIGNGLESMRFRCNQMKGRLEIISIPEIGTTIACRIPASSI